MNPYEVLKVKKGASAKEVRRAHRRRAMETHPDRGGSAEEFKLVSAAWRVLGDPQKRANYDRTGRCEPDVPDNRVALLVNVLVCAFRSCTEQLTREGKKLLESDLVAAMKSQLKGELAEIVKSVKDLGNGQGTLGRVLDRLEDRDEGLLARAVEAERNGLAARAALLERQAAVHREALEYLDGCSFKANKKKVGAAASGVWVMSFGTSGTAS